jgi:monoamine oxidase
MTYKKDRKLETDGLTRRSVLAGFTAGTVGALATVTGAKAQETSQTANKDGEYDVIIIGAGMAGTTAARELGTRGHRCLVLEARNRIGGRTFTTEVFGERADVGGQWINWIQPYVWSEITRYELDLLETPGANPTAYGVVVGDKLNDIDPFDAFSALESGIKKFCENPTVVFPRPFDPNFNPNAWVDDKLSVADRLAQLELTPVERAMLEAFFTTAANGPITESAYTDMVHWYARADGDVGRLLRACSQYKISTGTSSLINLMMKDSGATVRLDTTVTRVEQDQKQVRVVAEDGFVATAPVCIVALPMNCWNDIDWKPGISPGKIASSKERHTGQGFEMKLKLKGNKGAYQGMAPSTYPINMIYADKIEEDHTIMIAMGFSTPGFDMNDDDMVRQAVDRIMPGVEILESYAYDWNSDPFSKGTWCTYRPSMWTKYSEEMRKTEGRLVFAGADIANGWRGFIDGAIETGLRASKEVSEILSAGEK